jgi:hypothetical protein
VRLTHVLSLILTHSSSTFYISPTPIHSPSRSPAHASESIQYEAVRCVAAFMNNKVESAMLFL